MPPAGSGFGEESVTTKLDTTISLTGELSPLWIPRRHFGVIHLASQEMLFHVLAIR
ncbi:hypothetical protein VKS41_006047 [Umbelopsis sp. WA50703]